MARDGSVQWDLDVDTVLKRQEVHDRFGGSRRGGIASAPKADSVLLFATSSGKHYGYEDGWQDDGYYHYTGDGQVGDQQFVRGNKIVLETSRPLRLFEGVRKGVVRYVGEFMLDQADPYYRADAPDKFGNIRSVIVFRLKRSGSAQPNSQVPSGGQPQETVIPVQSRHVDTYVFKAPEADAVADRLEAALVERYVYWLHERGREARGREIRFPGRSTRLYVDLVDEGLGELVEAKAAASRNHVRLALGQLLDYSRHVKHKQLAVLVPTRPEDDLLDLLAEHGVTCIFENPQGQFERVEAV
ncbi:hypothetical protein GCM10011581_02440 [Saccharopolyspora subtropica]|uniref:ScoMcrA-like SRA domain-containing protein n=1 Tax=Saccharopolyspora thermophila TaxID=89367 RepID=A0A917JHM9_9PSEU|nr:hypothetical protein [Saccharopolyspora subtropica]GGI68948.1 hypothetical protein GCM10011581_02440 [Saccharopolyspora subtropica]